MLGLAVILAFVAPARAEPPVVCTCLPRLAAPGLGEALPANALLFLEYCDPRRGDPPLDALKVSVDGRPASLEVVPEWTTDLAAALRIVPQPTAGATVHLMTWFSPPRADRTRTYQDTYVALDIDEVPPATGGKPTIRRGEPMGTDACAPFERVLVDIEGGDLSREPITYGHVTMHGPNGERRTALSRVMEATPEIERWMHVPADVDRYEGRWCAELTMLDAAGNATALGTDCRTLDCACASGRKTSGFAGILVLAVAGLRRRRSSARVASRRCAVGV